MCRITRFFGCFLAFVMVLSLGCDAAPFAITAKGVIVMEAQTGKVLFEQNSGKRLKIASTTKIMTALLTVSQPDLQTYFTVDADAIKVEGSSMGLMAGDQVNLYALAGGMLLASGNDGANAAAARVGGSIPAFVEMMNQKAAEIGMKNTVFENPSGLDGEDHLSTAYDMALLTREALKNEIFASICSSKTMQLSYGNPPYNRYLSNHNRLLNEYKGCVGVKTGFTKSAGRCLVSAAERNGVTLICVTLGAADDWNVHKRLYDYYFDSVSSVPVEDIVKDKIFAEVAGGIVPTVELGYLAGEAVTIFGNNMNAVDYHLELPKFIPAPVGEGQIIGSLVVTAEGKELLELPLAAKSAVEQPEYAEKSFFENVKDFFEGLLL